MGEHTIEENINGCGNNMPDANFVPTLSPKGRGLQIHDDDQNKADTKRTIRTSLGLSRFQLHDETQSYEQR